MFLVLSNLVQYIHAENVLSSDLCFTKSVEDLMSLNLNMKLIFDRIIFISMATFNIQNHLDDLQCLHKDHDLRQGSQ